MKSILLFVVLLYSSSVLSCNVDQSKKFTLEDNILFARFIAVGKVKENKETSGLDKGMLHRFFIVKKKWVGGDIADIKIHTDLLSSCNSPLVQSEETYLFLYSDNIDIESNSRGVLDSKSLFIPISKAGKFIEQLAHIKINHGKDLNPSWKFCVQDSDCKKLSRCSGVNKKYEKEYLNFLKKTKKELNCQSVINAENSKCVENFCS